MMDDSTTSVLPALARIRQRSLVVGVIGLAATAAGAFAGPDQFFHSYLLAYFYWLGTGLGCLALVMIYHLTGGAWGVAARRVLEAGSRTLPVMAVLFLPLLFGLDRLYLWTHTAEVAADPVLRLKTAYLNVPFFIVRAVGYFVAWLALAYFLNRWSGEQDRTGDPRFADRLQRLSGGGLVLWSVAITFAAFDWIMSLEPHWFSTIFGMIVMTGSGLGALALVIAVLHLLSRQQGFERLLAPTTLNDLGNLLLAFVMLWAYLSFSQLLIIWAGNLPEEIPWYLHRITGSWRWVGVLLAVFYFAVPFLVLLGRQTKRRARALARVAAVILFMRLVDLYYFIAPEYSRQGARVHWMDVTALAGVGGIWLAMFAWQVAERPLLPLHDPELALALARKPE